MTSISELSNPRPSTGFPDFPTLRSHGSHSEGSSLGPPYNASHQTSVFHPAVNSTANYPVFCGAFAQNWQQQYTEGMPLFICRQVTKSERGTLTGRHVTHNILASAGLTSPDLGILRPICQKFVIISNDALIPCRSCS